MEFINERIHFISNLARSLKFLSRRIIPFSNLSIVNPETMSEVGGEPSGASQRMRMSLAGSLERMLVDRMFLERTLLERMLLERMLLERMLLERILRERMSASIARMSC
jgi:hypothetical protein